jgi:hypothetical protein
MYQINYKEYPAFRRFGVELELSNNLSKQAIGIILGDYESFFGSKKAVKVTPGAEGWAQSLRNNYWHVKFDRTCGPLGKPYDYGWEVASYIGCGVNDAKHIARAAKYLHLNGAITNLNCGLHIHVETKNFTSRKMGILLARWLKIEHVLIEICQECRRDNIYCQPLRTRIKQKKSIWNHEEPELLWYSLMPTDLSVHNNYEKRYSLNTIGFATAQLNPNFTRNTVELRLPECTLDESHVFNWTALFVNFVNSCETARAPDTIEPVQDIEDALFYLGLAGCDEFEILEPNLLGVKFWLLQKLSRKHQFSMACKAKKHLEFIGNF